MDDLNQAMGGTPPKTQLEEDWHAEQERKQYDIIRIVNPTQITVKKIVYVLPQVDFYVQYDVNKFQRIFYGQEMDIPRFRAERYVEHKKDDIVNFVAKKLHDDYLAERDRKGLPRYTDMATENKETYETKDYPKTDDKELIAEVFGQLWIGLVNKASSDTPPDQTTGQVDLSTSAQKAIDALQTKVVPVDRRPSEVVPQAPVVPQEVPSSPFAQMNEKLTPEEVSISE